MSEYRPRLYREIGPVQSTEDGILYRAITTTGHVDPNLRQGRPIIRVAAWRSPNEDGMLRPFIVAGFKCYLDETLGRHQVRFVAQRVSLA